MKDPMMEIRLAESTIELETIEGEWIALHRRSSRFPFGSPDTLLSWWFARGCLGSRLHVLTGRQNGKLVAVAPLVVSRRKAVRVLEWAGGELFDYADFLVDDPGLASALWQEISSSTHYDVAHLRDVHPMAACRDVLGSAASVAACKPISYLRFEWGSSEQWLREAVSASTRQYYNRTERRLGDAGPVTFGVTCDDVPDDVLDALYQQKRAWLQAQEKPSWLDEDPQVARALLRQIALAAKASGTLHLSWLRCGEHIIAVHLGLLHGRVLHWYLPSYDLAWSRFSPGRFLMMKLIATAIDGGQIGFDFMRGSESYKEQTANTHLELRDFVFVRSRAMRFMAEPALVSWYRRMAHTAGSVWAGALGC